MLIQAGVRISEFFESVSNDFSPHLQRLIGSLSDIGAYVRDNFWAAVQSAFGAEGGEGSPLDRVMSMLGRAWDAITGAAGSVGAAIAGGLLSYLFLADFELGDKLGYVAGLVIFEIVLAILTAGVSAELEFFESTFGQVLRLLVRANEAVGEVFGQIMKLIPGLESALTRLFTMLGDAPIIRQLVARFRTFFTELEELSLAGMRRYGGELATAEAGATGRALGGHADEAARTLGYADETAARTAGRHADEAVPATVSGDGPTARMAEGEVDAAVGVARSERQVEFVNALGEQHKITILLDGRIIRCSQMCIEFSRGLGIRAEELRASTSLSSEMRAQVEALSSRADVLARESREISVLSEAERATREADILARARALENDMASFEQRLRPLQETEMGFRQEEQIRNRLEGAGYEPIYGSTDEEIAQALQTARYGGGKPKSADFVLRDVDSDRWIVAESKGGDPEKAVEQLRITTDALLV